MRPFVFSLLLAIVAPALLWAEIPLGITGAEFSIGFVKQDSGAAAGSLGPIKNPGDDLDISLGFAAVNVALTQYHGVQGDAVLEETPDGAIGRLGAHLFMTPNSAQKYGIFGMLADVDGEAVTYGAAGVEGILALGTRTSIELRCGIGAASAAGLDFIFVGARVSHQILGGSTLIYAGYDLTEFDEIGFSAWAHDMVLGARVNLAGRGLSGFAEVSRSRLTGVDAAPDETVVRAGLTLSFGRIGGTSPLTGQFHTADPVSQLVRRGFF